MHLLGDVADTVALYEAIDLFALSSLREGLPNALLEAMAMRLPGGRGRGRRCPGRRPRR